MDTARGMPSGTDCHVSEPAGRPRYEARSKLVPEDRLPAASSAAVLRRGCVQSASWSGKRKSEIVKENTENQPRIVQERI